MSVYYTESGKSFHRKDCSYIRRSTNVKSEQVDVLRRRGLEACRVCHPDTSSSVLASRSYNQTKPRRTNDRREQTEEDEFDFLERQIQKMSLTSSSSNRSTSRSSEEATFIGVVPIKSSYTGVHTASIKSIKTGPISISSTNVRGGRFYANFDVIKFPQPMAKPRCLSDNFSPRLSLYEELSKMGYKSLYFDCLEWVERFDGKKRGLTNEQMIALRAYTSNEIYKDLNCALLDNKTQSWETTIHHIYSGLKKLCKPNIIKGSSRIYRGINKEAYLEVGYTIQLRGFNSTSRKESVARVFANNCTMFRILTWKVGAKIKFLSRYPEEDEVLLEPFANFKIVDVFKKNEVTYVDLEYC